MTKEFSSLESFFKLVKNKRTLIVGIGNILRGDDGVGVIIAEALRKMGLNVIVAEMGVENVIGEVINQRPEVLIFIDGVKAGLRPGDIVVCRLDEGKVRGGVLSTHAIPLQLLIRLIKEFIPDVSVYLVGIQVRQVGIALSLSPEVERSAKKLIRLFSSMLL
ncbi:MAG: hypothetical protein DRN15_01330 [Thermoprotei archaeon]|nr:MAG: hypothetical protein DRM97_04105 [Thermoprotei archaeon]RLF24904.1 MAG: hypothetical protein DRN15_01330 [Thermoprotei archaeon]